MAPAEGVQGHRPAAGRADPAVHGRKREPGDPHGLLGGCLGIDRLPFRGRQEIEKLRAGDIEHIQIDTLGREKRQRLLDEGIADIAALKHQGAVALPLRPTEKIHARRSGDGRRQP